MRRRTDGSWRRRSVAVAIGTIVLLGAAATSALAAAEEPWVLDKSSWQRGKDLLPEPVLKRVQSGEYSFRVTPADPKRFHDNYSRPFWDATAANEGRYDLDGSTCGLRDKATGKVPDFYFGYPFPNIEPGAPDDWCKIA